MQHVEILLKKVNYSTFWSFSHRQQPDLLKTGLNVGGKKAFCSNVAKQFVRFPARFTVALFSTWSIEESWKLKVVFSYNLHLGLT